MDQSSQKSGELVQDTTLHILHELSCPEYDFRSADSIALNIGKEPDEVKAIIGELMMLGVVRRPMYDTSSEGLYTLATRRPTWGERWNYHRSILATW